MRPQLVQRHAAPHLLQIPGQRLLFPGLLLSDIINKAVTSFTDLEAPSLEKTTGVKKKLIDIMTHPYRVLLLSFKANTCSRQQNQC